MSSEGFVPPHSIEAEQAVLGAVFVDQSCLHDVSRIVRTPEEFWRTAHQHIWRAMLALYADGTEIDWVTVADRVKSEGKADECGGADALHNYLQEISHRVPSAYGAERYATIVRDKATLREIVLRAGDLRAMALDETNAAREVLDRFVNDAMALSLQRTSIDPRHAAAIGEKVRERYEAGGVTGLESGWSDLDMITGGWKPGELIVVGARPGQGKSSFASAVALKHRDKGALVFSLEMDGEEIYPRMVAMHAGVDARDYARGTLGDVDRTRAKMAEVVLDHSQLWFDDSPKLSIQDVRAQSKRWATKHGIAMVVVDYLGLVDPTDFTVQRYQQLGEITRGLKQLARELHVPVVAPHQLSRNAENKEPTLADLRESGDIEANADQVIFVHRTGATNNGVTPVDLIVAKHRNGPTGKVPMLFRRACTRFEEVHRE